MGTLAAATFTLAAWIGTIIQQRRLPPDRVIHTDARCAKELPAQFTGDASSRACRA